MKGNFTRITYKEAGYFSTLITDWLDGVDKLKPFYQHASDWNGLAHAIEARKQFPTDRALLVDHLKAQYLAVPADETINKQIDLLGKPGTFTICTAHQPALFTGTLYFVYKILHAVSLSASLKARYPENDFVPVYWMGSEDADLDELGKFYMGTDKIVWNTQQKGAVGKMKTKGIDVLISRIEGELSVQPFGKELIQLLREAYTPDTDIQNATFRLLHQLFARFGVVVIIPDTAAVKKTMIKVFEEDLFQHIPSQVVSTTTQALGQQYKVQAHPREINLFYFKDQLRNRIEKSGEDFIVTDTDIRFTKEEIRNELHQYPERFSPNVILRGLYQETILPNIAFVGGGGETAYWLELKDLFHQYQVPYPVLILRNSFLLVEKKWKAKIQNSGFELKDFFHSEEWLLNTLVTRNKNGQLKLSDEMAATVKLYETLKLKATNIDPSLGKHVEALKTRTLKPMEELEKKILRAEKRKYGLEQAHLHLIKTALFPLNGLQERIDNFMPYYAKWGAAFLDLIYEISMDVEQEFGIWVEE